MDETRRGELERLFGQHIVICNSADPVNGTGAKGVAFVINKRALECHEYEFNVVVPGRAVSLKIKWSEGKETTIMNVYGPNDSGENESFWKELTERSPGRMDVMLGDLNVVEDQMDRMPMRNDREGPVNALIDLKNRLHLMDGWRAENPGKRAFTFLQTQTGSQSRLDVVFVCEARERDEVARDGRLPGVDEEGNLRRRPDPPI